MVQAELIPFLGGEQERENAGPDAGNVYGGALVHDRIRSLAYCPAVVELRREISS
jgi:hypothetical protein